MGDDEEFLSDEQFLSGIDDTIKKAFKFKMPQVTAREIFTTPGAMNLQDIGMWNLTILISYYEKGTSIHRRYGVPTYRTKEAVTQAVITCVASDVEVINRMFKAQVMPWASV